MNTRANRGAFVLVHSSSGYQVVREDELLGGPADIGGDVDYKDVMGNVVQGVVKAKDKSKQKVVTEMGRLRGMNNAGGSDDTGDESDAVISVIISRFRPFSTFVIFQGSVASSLRRSSRSSSIASAAASSVRAPTPRPTMVGKKPLSAPNSSRKRSSAAGPTPVQKRAAAGATAAAFTTPRRPVPSVPPLGSNQNAGGLIQAPATASFPLIPPSQMPSGFSLTGTPPLSLPSTTGNALLRKE